MEEKSLKFKPTSRMAPITEDLSVPYYIPDQIKAAYKFPKEILGEGNTIAIVEAFGSENIKSDLEVFSRRFGLPEAELEIVFPQGKPEEGFDELPWIIETSLDVEWAHAIAPKAKILLVVAKNDLTENLLDAVKYAAKSGAQVVSMSFGAGEVDGQSMFNEIFEEEGVVFVASSGDNSDVEYPATAPTVIATGATSLQLNECGERISEEIAWRDTGGGISQFELKPPWQYVKSNAIPKTNFRTIPDISFFGDSFPGITIYLTVEEQSFWAGVGGTSVSTVIIAAVYTIAIPPKGRLLNAAANLYKLAGICSKLNTYGSLKDISNGNNMFYNAIEGYDYTTGLGVPNVDEFIKSIRKIIEE